MVDEVSVDGRVLIDGYAEGFNGPIALVESSVLPEGILRTLHAAFPSRIVTYSTLFQIVSARHERSPRLIMLGTEIANGTIGNTIRSLSDLAPRIPTVVLAPEDDEDLARKVISLGAKAYIPVPTGCEVVAVIRFILAGFRNWPIGDHNCAATSSQLGAHGPREYYPAQCAPCDHGLSAKTWQ